MGVLYDSEEIKEETLLWTNKSKGMIYSHSIIEDSNGNQVAIIITEKK